MVPADQKQRGDEVLAQVSSCETELILSSDLRIDTIHAVDVAQALYLTGLWLIATPRSEALKVAGTELSFPFVQPQSSTFILGALKRSPSYNETWKTIPTVIPEKESIIVPMFNVTDDGHSTQESLASAVSQVWGIKYGFLGNTVVSLVEKFAKVGTAVMRADDRTTLTRLSRM